MANPTWDLLQKAQDDDETIEEAIVRLIAEHTADEEAHLGVGESLQSHKASEIIDHLALSIVADKIGNLEITADKLNLNSQYSQIQLESLDGWNQTIEGVGAFIDLMCVGVVMMQAGSTNTNRAFINIENSVIASYSEKDPFVQAYVIDNGDNASDIGIAFGLEEPFEADNGGFGIEYIKGDDEVFGFYNEYYGSAWHRHVVSLKAGPPDGEIWRAELDHTEQVIKFYINNILIETMDISENYYEFDDDFYISMGVKMRSSYEGNNVCFMNPIFNQKLSV